MTRSSTPSTNSLASCETQASDPPSQPPSFITAVEPSPSCPSLTQRRSPASVLTSILWSAVPVREYPSSVSTVNISWTPFSCFSRTVSIPSCVSIHAPVPIEPRVMHPTSVMTSVSGTRHLWMRAVYLIASKICSIESPIGRTKQADSWPSSLPAFISVGLLGMNSSLAIIS